MFLGSVWDVWPNRGLQVDLWKAVEKVEYVAERETKGEEVPERSHWISRPVDCRKAFDASQPRPERRALLIQRRRLRRRLIEQCVVADRRIDDHSRRRHYRLFPRLRSHL